MAGRFKRVRIPSDVKWGVIDNVWHSCHRCHTQNIRGNGTVYLRRSDGRWLSYGWVGSVCPKCKKITAGGITERISDKLLAFIILAAE